jgi:hypothetical protein
VARREPMLPTGPSFSPDGRSVAYVTQLNTPRLMVFDTSSGENARDLGPALPDCPPTWSAGMRLWVHQKSGQRSYWTERDATTGAETGARIEFPRDAKPDACWWPDASRGSPFFRRVRVERREYAQLLSVAAH